MKAIPVASVILSVAFSTWLLPRPPRLQDHRPHQGSAMEASITPRSSPRPGALYGAT